jgi:hypothetical protein
MKLSAGTIGTVLFTAAGIAVFVLMAKRPAVDGSAMNFGMPIPAVVAEKKIPEVATPEVTPAVIETTTETTTSMPEATAPKVPATPKVEPVKTEETTTIPAEPAESEASAPVSLDEEAIKAIKEEMPTTDAAPAVDGSMPTN